MHNIKDETIYVQAGVLILEFENETKILKVGERCRIKPKTIHRFCAPPDCSVTLLEVSTAELDDVVRLEDDYGR